MHKTKLKTYDLYRKAYLWKNKPFFMNVNYSGINNLNSIKIIYIKLVANSPVS